MSGEFAVKEGKDWHSSKHIAKRARYLLDHPDEEIPSDVTFVIGDGQNEPQKIFKCHKFILAMVSSMFQAMFYGPFPQTEDVIKIPDVTPKAFQHMLLYAYGGNLDLDKECSEDALDTLYCANKYLIDKLARACRDHLQFHIAVFRMDPCFAFQRAPQIGEENLAALAFARIAASTSSILKEDSFPRLSFDCVKRIVEYPGLAVKETDIYQGVRRWVECNVGAVTGSALRNAFGSLLYSIRFPLFSATELADGPITDDVLTDDEAQSILQYLSAQVKPELPFPTTPRTPLPACWWCQFPFVPAADPFDGPFFYVCPDLAPECCAFLKRLLRSKSYLPIASCDNKYAARTVAPPAAVAEERNVLTHSVKCACWFEWDMEGDSACNVRIGVGRKPHLYHSAVFGFVVGIGGRPVPFNTGDLKRFQVVSKF